MTWPMAFVIVGLALAVAIIVAAALGFNAIKQVGRDADDAWSKARRLP